MYINLSSLNISLSLLTHFTNTYLYISLDLHLGSLYILPISTCTFHSICMNIGLRLFVHFTNIYLYISLNLHEHFRVMQMRMTNANVTKNGISIGVIPFVWMQMWSTTTTNESLHVAISLNANGLPDWKSLRTQGCHRVAHTMHGGKLHCSLDIIRHSHSSPYSHYTHVES